MTSKIKKNSKGFTIVELLIVIVVIGILAALVIVQFTNVQARARDAERKSDIRALQSKVAEYYALNGYYPTALSQITSLHSIYHLHAKQWCGRDGNHQQPI
jgi:prepilin-type N-terminal cleavage/methylation domain-containing protein